MAETPAGGLPSVSVVINSLNRRDRLETTLEALTWIRYEGELEVVVVDGPSTDGTAQMLERWSDRVKVASVDVANLSVSRNEGIRHAAGDVVAFIDDDAVPEPEWIEHLARAYASADVGAAGGFVLDHTGHEYQYRYGQVDRFGGAQVDVPEPRPDLCYPGSWQIPHMLGANSSYRRDVLVRIGGYDEFFEYYLDESDVQLRVADAGYVIAQVPAARVHHHFAESHIRNAARAPRNRYPILKNKLYFALKHARDYVSTERVLAEFAEFVAAQRAQVLWSVEAGLLVEEDREQFERDVERATEDGLRGGLAGGPTAVDLGAPRSAFLRFPTRAPADPRRVVLVSQEYPPERFGGIGTYTRDLAHGLAAQGHEVHVLTTGEEHARVDWEAGAWIHRLPVDVEAFALDPARADVPLGPWAWSATVLAETLRIDAEVGPVDLVETPIWDSQGLAVLRSGRFPVVVALQTTLSTWLETRPHLREDPEWMASFGRPMLDAETELIAGAAGVRAISRAIAVDAAASHGLAVDERFQVLPLGIAEPVAPEGSAAAARVTRVPGRVAVLFVGRMEERKGVDVLLEAVELALDEAPELLLTLVGEDGLPWAGGESLRARFEARDLPEHLRGAVRFLGPVNEHQLALAYAQSDLFVAPSRYESFGLVFVEAMSRALPCLGTAVGGVPEVVRDGLDGLLVPADDARALADALVRLVRDEELRRTLGENGRRRYLEEFGVEAMAQRTRELYRAVLAGSRAAE